MQLSDFQFHLPDELIAQYPPEQRGSSRLLCLERAAGKFRDQVFTELPGLLKQEDLLVFNNTRVIPARLFAQKASGGKVEILVERVLDEDTMLCQLKASKSPGAGSHIQLEDGSALLVLERQDNFYKLGNTSPGSGSLLQKIETLGHMPLPPYIKREDEQIDAERYQTIYARHAGAVAAPTAGLHFSEQIMEQLKQQGIRTAFVTLHVGAGTFQPVRAEKVEDHKMHCEWFCVDDTVCEQVRLTRESGGRVIAVGTTSVRCLESACDENGEISPFTGDTNIFIYPGYTFRCVDALITNFHLPESTLLMLVSALAGKQNILRAYRHAVDESYRFFSYGDAMFIY